MICPTCGWDNLPGNEACSHCQQALTPFELPTASCKFERSLMEDKVRVLPLPAPITVGKDATVGQAVVALLDNNIGAVLVVDERDILLGIFSERDLLKKVSALGENQADLPVARFMTPRPECVSPDDTLDYVLHKMDGGGYRHLPVVKDGKPISVISVRDMLRHLTRLCAEGNGK